MLSGPAFNGNQQITSIYYISDDLIYISYTDGKIFKMDARGGGAPGAENTNFWTRFDILPAGGNPWPGGVNGNWGDRRINALTVDRGNPNIVYVGVNTFDGGRQIWRTADGGKTWNALNGAGATALPNLPVHTIRLLTRAQGAEELYVGNDAGVYVTRNLRNPAWERLDGNNLPYVQVKDLQWVGDTTNLIAATYGRGVYHIEVPPPPPPRPKENGRVWEDLNGNGLQDSGEPGLSGVAVKLYTAAGSLVASTSSEADGYYSFSDLDPGTYYVNFTAPGGYEFTAPLQGSNPFLDSDADPATGTTGPFSPVRSLPCVDYAAFVTAESPC